MANPEPEEVTLATVHQDLRAGFADLKTELISGFADLKGEMRTGFADLKVTLITGFQSLPTRESSEEMIRLLRENNRIQEERFTQLDVRIREQHLEIQQVLHALTTEIRALVTRIDALIKGRGDGSPSS